MKELDIEYDINVSNMKNITENKGDFKIVESEFYDLRSGSDERIKMNVLSDGNGKQIFSMKDDKFILEVEDENMKINYFYSENLDDLI